MSLFSLGIYMRVHYHLKIDVKHIAYVMLNRSKKISLPRRNLRVCIQAHLFPFEKHFSLVRSVLACRKRAMCFADLPPFLPCQSCLPRHPRLPCLLPPRLPPHRHIDSPCHTLEEPPDFRSADIPPSSSQKLQQSFSGHSLDKFGKSRSSVSIRGYYFNF